MENEKWFDESIVVFGIFIFSTVVAIVANGFFLQGGWFAGVLWILPFASPLLTALLFTYFEEEEVEGAEPLLEPCEQVTN